MWRRLSTQLRTPTPSRSVPKSNPHIAGNISSSPSPLRPTVSLFSRHFTTPSGENVVSKKKVEDVMPIATGHEREELEAQLEGRDILDINFPEGPFGTKPSLMLRPWLLDFHRTYRAVVQYSTESPAVVKSYYDKRIVGCPGVDGEDEHDVVWFWLEKGKPHECPVCSQYFVLEVVGPGGPPDGHGDDDHH